MQATSRRDLLTHSVLTLSALAVGSQVFAAETAEMAMPAASTPLAPLPDDALVRLLNRISFGVRETDLSLARRLGFQRYVEAQLDYPSIDVSELEGALLRNLPSLGAGAAELVRNAQSGQMEQAEAAIELQVASLSRQAFSPRQLYERMVEFWSDHFSVSIQDGPLRFFKTIDDRDVIRPHALGNFRDLLHATARSNAMLYYLDNFNNTRFGPNENYARELMELHTLGVDGGYTEADVLAVARCFTGWTFAPDNDYQFQFVNFLHDFSAKQVLATDIPAGGGESDGNTVLDLLARHPATASFISRKLAVRFVADDPPSELVDAMTETFLASDGDIAEVVRTMLFSSEFSQRSSAKLKRPIDYFVSLLRVLGLGPDQNLFRLLLERLRTLGQSPFTWPAPNGFPDQSAYWINTNALITRWNSANILISQLNRTQLEALHGEADTAADILSALEQKVLRQSLPPTERRQVLEFVLGEAAGSVRLQSEPIRQVTVALLVVLTASRYFQIR